MKRILVAGFLAGLVAALAYVWHAEADEQLALDDHRGAVGPEFYGRQIDASRYAEFRAMVENDEYETIYPAERPRLDGGARRDG